MPHRVILDSNLYLSYMLPPVDPNRTVFRIIDLVGTGALRLVLPEELINEVLHIVRTKPYFRDRVTDQGARGALDALRHWAEVPPRLSHITELVRDPKDDFLLAYAILQRVDFLVTGDRDLLVLDGEIGRLRIVTAAEFLLHLDEQRAEP